MGKADTQERWWRRGILGLNPWIWVYLITLALQFYRGAGSDIGIFGAASILLILNELGWGRFIRHERITFQPRWVWVGTIAIYLALFLIPWHTIWIAALLLAMLPVCVYFVWYQDRGPKFKASKAVVNARIAWVIYAILVCLWEYGANVLTVNTGDRHAFPTISVLVDPWLETTVGRAAFLVIWIALGLMFLRLWRKK